MFDNAFMLSRSVGRRGDPLRPHKFWYLVAVLVAAVGALATVAVLLRVPLGGTLNERIELGRPASIRVSGAGKMVWMASDEPAVAEVWCEPVAGSTRQAVHWSMVSVRDQGLVMNSDGRLWHGVLLVAAEPAGNYAVTCTTPATVGSMALSVGEPPLIHDVRAKVLAVSSALLLALTGLVLGSVVAIRRRRAAGNVDRRP